MGKRDEILEAAVRLFSTYGYHKTTMDQIAREAEVAKGTLYWHFSSKKDLFLGMVQADLERYFLFLEKLRDDQEKTSQEKVETLMNQRFTPFNERQSIMKEVMSHQESIDKEFKKKMFEIRQKHLDLLEDIFTQGIENDEFVISDPCIAAVAFMGMNVAISAHRGLIPKEKQAQMTQVLKDLIFHGILKSRD